MRHGHAVLCDAPIFRTSQLVWPSRYSRGCSLLFFVLSAFYFPLIHLSITFLHACSQTLRVWAPSVGSGNPQYHVTLPSSPSVAAGTHGQLLNSSATTVRNSPAAAPHPYSDVQPNLNLVSTPPDVAGRTDLLQRVQILQAQQQQQQALPRMHSEAPHIEQPQAPHNAANTVPYTFLQVVLRVSLLSCIQHVLLSSHSFFSAEPANSLSLESATTVCCAAVSANAPCCGASCIAAVHRPSVHCLLEFRP